MVVKFYTRKWLYSHFICLDLTCRPRATGNQFTYFHWIYSWGNWRKNVKQHLFVVAERRLSKAKCFSHPDAHRQMLSPRKQQLNDCTDFSKVAALAVAVVRQQPMPENIKPTTCVHYQAVTWGPRVRQPMLKITISIIAQLLHQQILPGDLRFPPCYCLW